MIGRLTGRIQPYAWGSTTAIPAIIGATPTDEPQAELWLGAHPSAPSELAGSTLDVIIDRDPAGIVGATSVTDFGPRLPYLLKILAAAQPLSLQAHPSRAEAEAGFARENAAGVDAAVRNYKDDWPKPEALCALEPAEALCGFREPAETFQLFAALGVDAATDLVAPLEHGGPEELEIVFGSLLRTAPAEIAAVVEAVVEAAAPLVDDDELGAFARTAVEVARFFPGDPGVLGALIMNRVSLQPFDALFLPAGNLHAYLSGTGVEIMANSDNVLRGGLTAKHIDVDELVSILDFTPGVPAPAEIIEESAGVFAYQTPAPEFALRRIESTEVATVLPAAGTGRIVLVTSGQATLRAVGAEIALAQGQSAFVSATEGETELVGDATVFVAAPGVPA